MMAEPIHIPVEVTTPPAIFDVVARGYDRAQVDEHLLQLEQELAEITWQRDFWESQRESIERDRLQLDEERSAAQAERDAWEPSFAALGDRAQEILRMAQAEADSLRDRTAEECAEQRERDQGDAADWRKRFEQEKAELEENLKRELETQRRAAKSEAVRTVHSARNEADEILKQARREAEALRLRALENLAAAQQERTKAARELSEIGERIRSGIAFLTAEPDNNLAAELNGYSTNGDSAEDSSEDRENCVRVLTFSRRQEDNA